MTELEWRVLLRIREWERGGGGRRLVSRQVWQREERETEGQRGGDKETGGGWGPPFKGGT